MSWYEENNTEHHPQALATLHFALAHHVPDLSDSWDVAAKVLATLNDAGFRIVGRDRAT